MSIQARISLGFACVCSLLVIAVVVTSSIVGDIDGRMERITTLRVPTTVTSLQLNVGVQEATAALRGWLVSGDPEQKKLLAAKWVEIEQHSVELDRLSQQWNDPSQSQAWQRCRRLLTELKRIHEQIAAVAHTPEAQPGVQLFLKEAVPLYRGMYRMASAMIDTEKHLHGQPGRREIVGHLADLRGNMAHGWGGLQSYLLTADRSHLADFQDGWQTSTERLYQLQGLSHQLTPEQRRALESYEEAQDELGRLEQRLIAMRESSTWDLPNHLLLQDAVPVRDAVADILSGARRSDGSREGGIVAYQTQLLEDAQRSTSDQVSMLMYTTWGLLAGGFLASVLIAWLASRSITVPVSRLVMAISGLARGDTSVQIQDRDRRDEIGRIAQSLDAMAQAMRSVSETCEAISTGDLGGKVPVRSDRDQLASSVNRMVDTFQEIVAQANAIAQGDYHRQIAVRGKRDELGVALRNMTEALRQAAAKNQRDTWLRTGQREVIESMQGEHDMPALSRHIITTLGRYLGAQVGVLYVASAEGTLRLMGSYAHVRRKQLMVELEPGESLVGQAALERQTIVLASVPEDYITIDSGLGTAPPRSLAIIPLLSGQEVRGVIELGKLEPFTDTELELLGAVSENIAIGLGSAQHFLRIQELLQETQRQSQRLMEQSEELRAANEELEEQTALLGRSRQELQAQSEALRATNEELEEQAALLEHQTQEIGEKNAVLEKARRELTDKARELEQTSRYKSEFLANMSHELRTPLNSLLILSRLLAENEGGNLTEEQVNAARVIYSGGKDLLELINDILDLSKVEAGMLGITPESVSLDALAGRLRMHFAPLAGDKGLELTMDIAAGMPRTMHTDRMRLEQILRNLLANAVKFTSAGSVRLRVLRPGAETVPGLPCRADEIIAFEVSDTGIGIPQDKQQEIFEAFKQADGSTSRKYGGTGLGLTISRELARRLGGEIHVHSREGEGSTFTLYLPEDAPAATPAGEPGQAPTTPRAGQPVSPPRSEPLLRAGEPGAVAAARDARPAVADDRLALRDGDRVILIIEDDAPFAEVLSRLCRDHGYKCLVAPDGVTGLRLAREARPSAIFLDLQLPDLDGLLVLEQLKFDLASRHIPVHVISARDPGTGAMQRGAIGFLRKPMTVEDVDALMGRVEQYLATRVKTVLLVEDSEPERDAVIQLIKHSDIEIRTASTGQEALAALESDRFDCVILDLQMPDMSGFEVLRALSAGGAARVPPVIVYTGRDLTRQEHLELSQYTSSIVIKGANSPERLLDEASLFLHSVESSLPPSQRKMIRTLHDPDQVLRGRTILLVDDNLRSAFAVSGTLKSYGLEVILADSGQLALDKLESEPSIDLILMDIMMPHMDGYETMRRIRGDSRRQAVPIIALTAKAMPEDRARCLEAGANDYLSKPVDIDQLITLLRVWLFGRNDHS